MYIIEFKLFRMIFLIYQGQNDYNCCIIIFANLKNCKKLPIKLWGILDNIYISFDNIV